MKISRSDYTPQHGDVLFVSRDWDGGIGIVVYQWDKVREWGTGTIMRSSETERYGAFHYLLHHGEFEPGRFYWIWRDTGEERPQERHWSGRWHLSSDMKRGYDV